MTGVRRQVWIGLASAGLLAICLGGLLALRLLGPGSGLYPDALVNNACSRPIVKADSRPGPYLDLYVVYEACLITDARPKRVIEWYDEQGWKVVLDGVAATGTTTRLIGPLRYTTVKAVVSLRRSEPTTIIVRQGFRLEIKLGK